jgi:hypothetical protein
MAQMVVQFQIRRDEYQTKADRGDQQRMAGIKPDCRRLMRKATHDHGRQRNAGDQQQSVEPRLCKHAAAWASKALVVPCR